MNCAMKTVGAWMLVAFAAAVMNGCSSPIDDKPAATIGEAVPTDTPANTVAPTEHTDASAQRTDTEPKVATEPADAAAPDATAEPARPAPTVYAFNDNTYIGFAGSKPLGTHYGQFPGYEGSVTITGDDVTTAKIQLTIDTTRIEADDSILTATLKGENFFKVDEFPSATFESTGVAKSDTGYTVTGNLAIRGITKSVQFPAEITLDGAMLKASAEFSIDRNQWKIGVGWTQTIINDNVLIDLAVEAEPTK